MKVRTSFSSLQEYKKALANGEEIANVVLIDGETFINDETIETTEPLNKMDDILFHYHNYEMCASKACELIFQKRKAGTISNDEIIKYIEDKTPVDVSSKMLDDDLKERLLTDDHERLYESPRLSKP